MFAAVFVLGEAAAGVNASIGFLCLAVFTAGVLFSRTARKLFPVLPRILLLICLWAGFIRMQAVLTELPPALSAAAEMEADLLVTGEVKSITFQNENWVLTTKNNLIYYEGEQYPLPYLLTYLKESAFPEHPYEIKIGMKVRLSGELSSFSQPRNPGEFNYQSYYQAIKIRMRLFADEIMIIDESFSPYYDGCRRLREYWGNILEQICAEEDMGLLKAVLLGDKADLDIEIRQLYQRNGIAHLLAISGLHVSMIGMGIYRFMRWWGAGFKSAGLVSGMLVFSYGILTGFGASAARAVIMILCHFLAEYLGRTYDILSAVSLAGLLILFDSPLLLFQSGFQLSFGAVLAISGPGRIVTGWIGKTGRFLEGMAVSVMIQLITCPIILYHFFQFPIYGIFLNLLVLPLIGIVVGSGILGIAAGSFSISAGVAAVGASHYVLLCYRKLCEAFEMLPGCSLVLGRPGMWQIVIYYGIVSAFLLWAAGTWSKEKRIGRAEQESDQVSHRAFRQRRWGIYLAVCIVCFFLLFPRPVKELEITFLDVGQGDGMFMETADCTILVDGGSSQVKDVGKYRLEPFLKSRGVSRIDYAFVSHADSDHMSGVEYLLKDCKEITIRNLVLPCLGRGEEVYDELEGLARSQGGKVWYMKQGDRLTEGKLSITCLFPHEDFAASNRNEQSEVLSVVYGQDESNQGFRMLLTGDVEQEGEAEMVDNRVIGGVHVLKAAHHGSETSTTEAFLDAAAPRWCVLSYGEDNSYGHPHRQVVDRLRDRGIIIWETAKSGAVMLQTDGRNISINGFVDHGQVTG